MIQKRIFVSSPVTRIVFDFRFGIYFPARQYFRFYIAYRQAQAIPGAWQEITGNGIAGNAITGDVITGDVITEDLGLVSLCNTNR
jgi:hypothetical protein